jgi:hypothetical protein
MKVIYYLDIDISVEAFLEEQYVIFVVKGILERMVTRLFIFVSN